MVKDRPARYHLGVWDDDDVTDQDFAPAQQPGATHGLLPPWTVAENL